MRLKARFAGKGYESHAIAAVNRHGLGRALCEEIGEVIERTRSPGVPVTCKGCLREIARNDQDMAEVES